jgi:hypothetical protein
MRSRVKIPFLSKYFLGHRSIISPPICKNVCSHALPPKVAQAGKRISGANTKNESQRENGLRIRTESRSPTGIRTDAALRYCIRQADAKTSELPFFSAASLGKY